MRATYPLPYYKFLCKPLVSDAVIRNLDWPIDFYQAD